jgi:very-short-patch-repair endonuclease
MRRESTDAEKRLWLILRNRTLDNWKFRRQVPIGDFIVDFCCIKARLIVELDGEQHLDQLKQYDDGRTKRLESMGFRVLRFWNSDVVNGAEGAVAEIARVLDEIESNRAKVR